MADHNDIATAIHSALREIGVAGEMEVSVDDAVADPAVEEPAGDDMVVMVRIKLTKD